MSDAEDEVADLADATPWARLYYRLGMDGNVTDHDMMVAILDRLDDLSVVVADLQRGAAVPAPVRQPRVPSERQPRAMDAVAAAIQVLGPIEPSIEAFFEFAQERHRMYIRRFVERQPPPWTNDPILANYRFTNVYRQLDRTTEWYTKNVTGGYADQPDLLPATAVFRWFNKIETGEVLLNGRSDDVLFDHWVMGEVTPEEVRSAIVLSRGQGPYVTAAYIVKTPNGMSKLDGVLQACDNFLKGQATDVRGRALGWREAAEKMVSERWTLEQAWEWVRAFPYQGDFTAYEVVSDLRHTYLLRDASDIMLWANAGPGAIRGLNRLHKRDVDGSLKKQQSLYEMRDVLRASKDHWSPNGEYWPEWEMREVEHTLCEFDKYCRARNGEGTPKQRYTPR
jgi:hypothetical protein